MPEKSLRLSQSDVLWSEEGDINTGKVWCQNAEALQRCSFRVVLASGSKSVDSIFENIFFYRHKIHNI